MPATEQSGPSADLFEPAVRFDELPIDRSALVSTLGYTTAALPEAFAEMLERSLAEARRQCALRAGYRLVGLSRDPGLPDVLVAGKSLFHPRPIVAGALASASHAAAFACTLGPAYEAWTAAAFRDGDPALGYIADAVGSAVAEALAAWLHAAIKRDLAARGWTTTNRYSPGYCGWSVAEQHQLFGLLPPRFCGISLNDSALMQPVKSVSGLIGAGPKAVFADYQCGTCDNRPCPQRLRRTKEADARRRLTGAS